MTKKASFSRRIFDRTGSIYTAAKEIDEAKKFIQTGTTRAFIDSKESEEFLKEALAKLNKSNRAVEAAFGHLAEIDTEGLVKQTANLSTLASGQEFMNNNDPETILSNLKNLHIPTVEDQMVKLEEKRFVEYYDMIGRAKARRYHKKLEE